MVITHSIVYEMDNFFHAKIEEYKIGNEEMFKNVHAICSKSGDVTEWITMTRAPVVTSYDY